MTVVVIVSHLYRRDDCLCCSVVTARPIAMTLPRPGLACLHGVTDFTRREQVLVERYTVDELTNIARLMKTKEPFKHLLKLSQANPLLDNQIRPAQSHCGAHCTTQRSSEDKRVLCPTPQLSNRVDCQDGSDEDDDLSIDENIFHKMFRPVVYRDPESAGSSHLPKFTDVPGRHDDSGSDDDSTNSDLNSSLPCNTQARSSPQEPELTVDDETFNKVFRRIPMAKPLIPEPPPILPSLELSSSPLPYPKKTPEASLTGMAEKTASLGQEFPGAENVSSSTAIRTGVKSQDARVTESQISVTSRAALRTNPEIDKSAPSTKRVAYGICSSDKNRQGRRRPPQVHRSSRCLNKYCSAKMYVQQSKIPLTDLVAATTDAKVAVLGLPMRGLVRDDSDARQMTSWDDSKASRALRRMAVFVEKGGRVSASRYSSDFISAPLTVNSTIYAVSALTTADAVVQSQLEAKQARRVRKSNPKVEHNIEEAHLKPDQFSCLWTRAATVPGTDGACEQVPVGVVAFGENSGSVLTQDQHRVVPQVLGDQDSLSGKCNVTRCGRTVKCASRFSDYFLGSRTYKRRNGGKPEEGTDNDPIQTVTGSSGPFLEEHRPVIVKKECTDTEMHNLRVKGMNSSAGFNCVNSLPRQEDARRTYDNSSLEETKEAFFPPFSTIGRREPCFKQEEDDAKTIAPVMFFASVCSDEQIVEGKATLFNEVQNSGAIDTLSVRTESTATSSREASINARHVFFDTILAEGTSITDEEKAALEDLNELLYDKPTTVSAMQLLQDLTTTLCLEIRNHVQLIRWKSFLKTRYIQMIEQYTKLKGEMELLSTGTSPLRAVSCAKARQQCFGPTGSERPVPHVQSAQTPRFAPTVRGNHSSSKRNKGARSSRKNANEMVYLNTTTCEPSIVVPLSNRRIAADGLKTALLDDDFHIGLPPPSLVVHPVKHPSSSQLVVPVSPIVPAGQLVIAGFAQREDSDRTDINGPQQTTLRQDVARQSRSLSPKPQMIMSAGATQSFVALQPQTVLTSHVAIRPVATVGSASNSSPVPRIIRRLIPVVRSRPHQLHADSNNWRNLPSHAPSAVPLAVAPSAGSRTSISALPPTRRIVSGARLVKLVHTFDPPVDHSDHSATPIRHTPPSTPAAGLGTYGRHSAPV